MICQEMHIKQADVVVSRV